MSKPVDRNRMATVVEDSIRLGVDGAARAHGLSKRTVIRYRGIIGIAPEERPAVIACQARAEAFAALRKQHHETMLATLDRIGELLPECVSLRDVAYCFKVLHEAELADRMLDIGFAPRCFTDETGAAAVPSAGTLVDDQKRAVMALRGVGIFSRRPRSTVDVEGGDA